MVAIFDAILKLIKFLRIYVAREYLRGSYVLLTSTRKYEAVGSEIMDVMPIY